MAWRESLDDRARAVLVFWFGKGYAEMAHTGMVDAHVTKMWFNAGPEFDETVRSTFTADLEALAAGEYDPWLTSSNVYNGIAGIVLADQFSRNAFRGTARAFELDPKARKWASYLLDSGHAADIPLAFRAFLNIPFVHSEAEEDVQRCVDLTGATLAEGEAAEPPAKDELLTLLRGQYRYAVLHLDVIKRWGRYPHRNAALGRPDTPEEAAGLADGSIMRF